MIYLLNGVLCDSPVLPVSPLSPLVNFGQGFFETILYENGVFEYHDAHLDRLRRACSDAGFSVDTSLVDQEHVAALIRSCGMLDATLRIKIICAALGEEASHLSTIAYCRTYRRPVAPYRVAVHSVARSDESMHRYKSLNYAINLQWKNHYAKLGYDEVLFVNRRGEVIEGSCTNVGVEKDGILHLVGDGECVLRGIFETKVLEDPAAFGFKAAVQFGGGLTKEILDDADGVFVMNSLLRIKPVQEVSWIV